MTTEELAAYLYCNQSSELPTQPESAFQQLAETLGPRLDWQERRHLAREVARGRPLEVIRAEFSA